MQIGACDIKNILFIPTPKVTKDNGLSTTKLWTFALAELFCRFFLPTDATGVISIEPSVPEAGVALLASDREAVAGDDGMGGAVSF